ncbi:MAG: orotate phosphoribosyltransferase [Candidatus Kapabacteria bacterium]|nr:orotate phosphoribosyltransferase [Ignavibacteriota bacterium]MCW5883992.1 orotate phosphoribosyltransferase [Candidatus Kapabacteria bacterium]
MTREQLAAEIYKASYIKGEFLLRSGKISNEYFDKYQFESNPVLLDAISDFMIDLLPNDFDMFGALEMGGIPLATLLSVKTGKPVIFTRKKAKEYGTQKFAEGPDYDGKKILIVEDVVTSGGQIILSVKDLRSTGALIQDAVCVIDREASGVEALTENNICLHPLFTMSYIKNAANKAGLI